MSSYTSNDRVEAFISWMEDNDDTHDLVGSDGESLDWSSVCEVGEAIIGGDGSSFEGDYEVTPDDVEELCEDGDSMVIMLELDGVVSSHLVHVVEIC